MSYKPTELGSAERRRYVEISQADVPALTAMGELTEPPTADAMDKRRYAQFVAQANRVPASIDGSIVWDMSTLLEISRDLLNVSLSGILDPALSVIVEEDTLNNTTWIAEAEAGASSFSPVWRIKKVETITNGMFTSTETTWLSGSGDFEFNAVPPLSTQI